VFRDDAGPAGRLRLPFSISEIGPPRCPARDGRLLRGAALAWYFSLWLASCPIAFALRHAAATLPRLSGTCAGAVAGRGLCAANLRKPLGGRDRLNAALVMGSTVTAASSSSRPAIRRNGRLTSVRYVVQNLCTLLAGPLGATGREVLRVDRCDRAIVASAIVPVVLVQLHEPPSARPRGEV